jgi:hypothetical protein
LRLSDDLIATQIGLMLSRNVISAG